VTCYFRHLKEIFKKAGIEVTRENKREVDGTIHGALNLSFDFVHFACMHISSKFLIVVYKERNKEGFVITAFMTSKIDNILRRKILWQRQ
jgi:hypothetical protein